MAKFGQSQPSFTVPGRCFVCNKDVEFAMNIPSGQGRGVRPLNWREGLKCPDCCFNNRTRATIHILQQECLPSQDSAIYMTEQTTRLFRLVKENYPSTVGSEYLGDEVPFGQVNAKGIRNESVTGLTFPDNSLDFILSFDVFEHVPDYRKGFADCLRCLKPGGRMVFSVPFIAQSESTLVRATMGADGTVTHLLAPEYHGDPINSKGCLCFYHFGWEMLGSLRDSGFEKAETLLYWSIDFGYLGNGDQIIFLAKKPDTTPFSPHSTQEIGACR
jgi:SAM-dependent methyltransferase